jgi:hypothetical protein
MTTSSTDTATQPLWFLDFLAYVHVDGGQTADRMSRVELAGSSVWVEPARRGPRLTAAQRLVGGHMHAGDQG